MSVQGNLFIGQDGKTYEKCNGGLTNVVVRRVTDGTRLPRILGCESSWGGCTYQVVDTSRQRWGGDSVWVTGAGGRGCCVD